MTSHCLATGSFLVISHKIMKCILILNKYPSVLLFSLASFILLSFSSSLLLPWHASLLLLIVLNSDLPSWPQHLSSISPLLLPCPFKEWAYRLPSFLPGCWVMSYAAGRHWCLHDIGWSEPLWARHMMCFTGYLACYGGMTWTVQFSLF